MITWRSGVVSARLGGWRGAVELTVDVGNREIRALAYPALTGEPQPGDQVLLNTGALEAGLGTGGYALVIAVPDRLPPDTTAGRLVKARYTPLQVMVHGAEDDLPADAEDLGGMPVVVADLHSALPPILAAFYAERLARSAPRRTPGQPPPNPGVGYVMLDGGALPAWYSRTLAGLSGWLAGTVTVGQAFGGDLEAVTVHTGLLAARHLLGAEAAIVAPGPGNLGTGTRWGFSGVAVGEAVNAAAVLRGRPIAALRISGADSRERHRGISHHSLTALGRVALARADVVLPELPGPLGDLVRAQAAELAGRHDLIEVPTDRLEQVLRESGFSFSSMGRGLDDDPSYFLAAAAAGGHAARLLGQA